MNVDNQRAAEPPRAIVIGGGPAGLAAALALTRYRVPTRLMGPPHRPLGHREDSRTAALFAGSITLLQNLGVWEHCVGASDPITAIRIIDDTGGWPRAPEVLFTAADVGLAAFGYNVPNAGLVEAMLARAKQEPLLELLETRGVMRLEASGDGVVATTEEGYSFEASLAIAADGRKSLCRDAAGIGLRRWSYEQSAITALFAHGKAHDGVSTELHRRTGPLTVVPMPGNRSSLVWVERPEEAQRLAQLDDSAFRSEIEGRLGGLLGRIADIGQRGVFPLSGLTAEVMGRRRVALVGESGHVIPPIGAQGLNLGLRDAATIAELAGEALACGADIGTEELLNRYSHQRAGDVSARSWTIDILNRSLLSPLLPVHLLRGLGLAAMRSIAPLRRLAVREGLQPSYGMPRMMTEACPDTKRQGM